MIGKHLDSHDSEFLDRNVSSDTDFEDDALLLDLGDNSGVFCTVYVTIIFCGRTWTILSEQEKFLVELVDLKTVLRV
jgi:hypothetical protein